MNEIRHTIELMSDDFHVDDICRTLLANKDEIESRVRGVKQSVAANLIAGANRQMVCFKIGPIRICVDIGILT